MGQCLEVTPQGPFLEANRYLGMRKVLKQRCTRIMNHPWEGLGTFLHQYKSTVQFKR